MKLIKPGSDVGDGCVHGGVGRGGRGRDAQAAAAAHRVLGDARAAARAAARASADAAALVSCANTMTRVAVYAGCIG